jgi:hypothetical protein
MTSEHDEEIIADLERDMAEGRELNGYTRVKGRVSRRLTVSYAIRMSPVEYDVFNEAARARGMTLADFMRSATRAAIAGEIDAVKAAVLNSAREKAEELAEALRRL